MSTIENPPKIDPQEMFDFIVTPPQEDVAALVDKLNEEYEYWDTIKYSSRGDRYLSHSSRHTQVPVPATI